MRLNAVIQKCEARANQQSDATADSSRRELTCSSQNEPSSSAGRQWNVSTLTKSWEETKLKLVRLYKAAVLPELALPRIRNGQSIREWHFCHRLLRHRTSATSSSTWPRD